MQGCQTQLACGASCGLDDPQAATAVLIPAKCETQGVNEVATQPYPHFPSLLPFLVVLIYKIIPSTPQIITFLLIFLTV